MRRQVSKRREPLLEKNEFLQLKAHEEFLTDLEALQGEELPEEGGCGGNAVRPEDDPEKIHAQESGSPAEWFP